MVYYQSSPLDNTFAALSDATRRGILARLAQGEASISDLAAPYEMSLPAVSKHLRVLERAKLVERRKDGRVHRCRLAAEPMKGAAEWIAKYRRFWERQFGSLAQYLEGSQKEYSQKEEDSKWQPQAPHRKPGSKSGARSERRARKSSRHGRSAKN
jgi:DNA-binding transcriptional ArsR family regulator